MIVERLGGAEKVTSIEARLRESFATPFQIGGHSFSIAASIGAAIWPLDVDDPEELLRSADAAMYEVEEEAWCPG